ncbi:MAG: hypothetical protein CL911_07695 [Deltaproteobacteria bacterium]|nr:hypothetical protein [Deltaproteobacteria bacterium]
MAAKTWDGTGTFGKLHDELVTGGAPLDSFAEASLRDQEYWLMRRNGGDTGAHRPRQEETIWASGEWRAFWVGRIPLRRDMTKLEAYVYGDFHVSGAGDVLLALDLVGIAREEISVTADASGETQTITLEWSEPLAIEVDEALLVLEIKGERGAITWLTESSNPVLGTWEAQRRLKVDATASFDSPSAPNEVFMVRPRGSGDDEDIQMVELRGPDTNPGSLTLNTFPALKPGNGDSYEIGRADIGAMTLQGIGFRITWAPDGTAPSFIAYPLSQLRANIPVEGRVVSVHDHNSSGIYERHPLWRACWHDGSSHDDGENVIDVRWDAKRVIDETGTVLTPTFAPTAIRVPRENARVRCSFDVLLWLKYAPGSSIDRRFEDWVQSVTFRLVASQFTDGSSTPTTWTREVDTLVQLLNPAAVGNQGSDLLAQLYLGARYDGAWNSALYSATGSDVGWREHIFDLADLLAIASPLALDLDLSGANPNRPVGFHLELEPGPLNSNIRHDPTVWAAVLSRTLTCYGAPF